MTDDNFRRELQWFFRLQYMANNDNKYNSAMNVPNDKSCVSFYII